MQVSSCKLMDKLVHVIVLDNFYDFFALFNRGTKIALIFMFNSFWKSQDVYFHVLKDENFSTYGF